MKARIDLRIKRALNVSGRGHSELNLKQVEGRQIRVTFKSYGQYHSIVIPDFEKNVHFVREQNHPKRFLLVSIPNEGMSTPKEVHAWAENDSANHMVPISYLSGTLINN